MNPLAKLQKLREILEFSRGHSVPVDSVINAIEPVIRQLRAAEGAIGLTDQWIALPKAMTMANRSPTFFRAKITWLGGKSRLEAWAAEGLAKIEGRNWFLSATVLADLTQGKPLPRGRARDRRAASEGVTTDLGLDSLKDMLNDFLDEAA